MQTNLTFLALFELIMSQSETVQLLPKSFWNWINSRSYLYIN